MKTALFIYTETPLHAGTGTGLGAVDLPIQREKHTNYPIIQASGVKGAVRNALELVLDGRKISSIFGGASGEEGEDHAGAISPSDARILLFPVRALKGVFVWVTSPTVLDRFAADIGIDLNDEKLTMPKPSDDNVLVSHRDLLIENQVMLEEYAYGARFDDAAEGWAKYLAKKALPANADWRTRLENHLVVLPDDEFRDFVTYATEIVTRIKINPESKVVDKEQGALFTQELLPSDSLLYSAIIFTKERSKNGMSIDDVIKEVKTGLKNMGQNTLQIGADETVGRGRVQLKWQGEA